MITEKIRNKRDFLPFLAILTLGIAKKFILDNGFLMDSFHNGEFFASFVQNSAGSVDPVFTIHGAVDWLPAEFASYLMPLHHIFGLTVLLYQFVGLLATLIFMKICLNLTKELEHRILMATFAGFLGFLAIDHRDFGILIILLVVSELWDRKLTWKLSVSVACIGYFGGFWYYSRGLIGLVILGLFFLFKQHKQIPVFLSTLIALCLVVPYLSPSFGLHFTIRNVLKIQEGASEWSHNRPVLEDGLLQLILLIFIASIMAVLIHSYPRLKSRQIDPKTFIFLILLIGFLPISINRVDYQHALMIAWPTFMLWVHLFSKSFPMKSIEKLFYAGPIIGVGVLAGFSLRGGNHLYLIILALLLFALLLIYFSVSKRISDLLSKFLLPFLIISYSVLSFQPSASTFNGLIAKSDWQRVTPEIRWAATKVKLSNSSCLFDFTNQGLIAGLTLIPNCSQYAYPIYTPRPDDKELRNELIKSSPRTLVLSSNFWSYSIDGLTMPERYPLTSAYLATKYRSTECFKGTCVANLK